MLTRSTSDSNLMRRFAAAVAVEPTEANIEEPLEEEASADLEHSKPAAEVPPIRRRNSSSNLASLVDSFNAPFSVLASLEGATATAARPILKRRLSGKNLTSALSKPCRS